MRSEIGRALRIARRAEGIRQVAVAARAGISQPHYSRIERGQADAGIPILGLLADSVGLELRVQLHPTRSPLVDAGHVRLTQRLMRLLPSTYVWQSEVPLPVPGDRRAIDAIIARPRLNIGFECETRLGDTQATCRRAALKQRDGHLAAIILVLSDTRHNRAAVRAEGATLRATFPLDSREILAALRAGRSPAGNGILFA